MLQTQLRKLNICRRGILMLFLIIVIVNTIIQFVPKVSGSFADKSEDLKVSGLRIKSAEGTLQNSHDEYFTISDHNNSSKNISIINMHQVNVSHYLENTLGGSQRLKSLEATINFKNEYDSNKFNHNYGSKEFRSLDITTHSPLQNSDNISQSSEQNWKEKSKLLSILPTKKHRALFPLYSTEKQIGKSKLNRIPLSGFMNKWNEPNTYAQKQPDDTYRLSPPESKEKLSFKRYTNNLKDSDTRHNNLSDTYIERYGYTAQKWNEIESEHHMRQQQHANEMQALRKEYISSLTQDLTHESNSNNENVVTSTFYVPGVLTNKKTFELGSTVAIEKTRKTLGQVGGSKALANAHVTKVQREATCHTPQPRVRRVMKDPAKNYAPHCTVLHRCGDDTGCCRNQGQTCAAKETTIVHLYFFVKSIHEKRSTIEKLSFINHTECHCVERSLIEAASEEVLTEERQNLMNCICPKLYEKIVQDDGNCRCDCSSSNTDCNWLKRGMEHFSMNDRKCISEGRCRIPTCEYGDYMINYGQCPRRL